VSKGRIRKDDDVIAVRGSQRGKRGKVLQVLTISERVLVEGVNLKKKCLRKSQDNPQGGIIDKEVSMAISNVMLYCEECKKGVKVASKREDTKSVRKCRVCGHILDS
jgi:large subunit ribosomal protein L24